MLLEELVPLEVDELELVVTSPEGDSALQEAMATAKAKVERTADR